ncbi:MAG: hypothetical protein LBK66_12265, partial [Spirochaetaceae bacterium]|nr:hypothetical protein [Spirochaetaceae bacterium]
QKFSIIAIPEDPQAELSINLSGESLNAGAEIPLTEGKTDYTITVSQPDANPNTNTYTFTVSYEPDLTLKSIELTSGENEGWIQNVLVQDGQKIIIPYGSVTIAASSSGDGVELAASETGSGDLSPGGPGAEWTLTYPNNQNIYAFYSDVKITSTKSTNGGDYRKDFILKFEKIVDANWPTSYWATSIPKDNVVSIIKKDDKYYEVHTFIKSGTLSFPTDDLTTQYLATAKFDYLIVAGGGGGGGGFWYAGGGGGGAGGALYKTGETPMLTAGSVSVTVGTGGNGGGGNTTGGDGGQSSIGSVTVPGGGGGGGSTDNTAPHPGNSGGSGGGGGGGIGYSTSHAGGGVSTASNGIMGKAGGSGSNNNILYSAKGSGGGGASGNGQDGTVSGGTGGAPWEPDGEAAWVKGAAGSEFSRGGNGGGTSAGKGADGQTYGNGGSGGGAQRMAGGKGHSGIVVIRFPAKPNDSGSKQPE